MKSRYDPRHLKRICLVQDLFAWSFNSTHPQTADLSAIIANIQEIDSAIQKNAPKWPLNKINRTDLSVLRLALWELVFKKEAPVKVVIDEAIELAKEFGSESSPSFVNGTLGSIVKQFNLQPDDPPLNPPPDQQNESI